MLVNVLKSVMDRSPELVTDDLPNWLAFHSFDQNSNGYRSVREESFKYLTSFATQSVLEKALSIVEKNEHIQGRFSSFVLQVSGPFSLGSF